MALIATHISWYEICLRLSESYEPCRTKVDWRYLYLTFANSARDGEILIFAFFFVSWLNTVALVNTDFNRTQIWTHTYRKWMQQNYELRLSEKCDRDTVSLFFPRSLVYSPIQHTHKIRHISREWHGIALVFNNSWHSHFSKSCQASAAVFGDVGAVAADLLESLMIFHSICWMQNANASAENANRRIWLESIICMCVCLFFCYFEICDCQTVRCISAFDVSLNFRR